jgi:hypothetical protein
MCQPSSTKLAEFRDVLRDLLLEYIDNTPEELIIGIVSAARMAFTTENEQPKRIGTVEAMQVGLNRVESIRSRCYERFKLNYSWNTKLGQDILEFLSTRPDGETVDKFADWYWSDDWRRTKRGAPSLTEIYTFWPQAFERPEYKSDAQKIGIFRAGENE